MSQGMKNYLCYTNSLKMNVEKLDNANQCFSDENNYRSDSTGTILVSTHAHSQFPL